MGNLTWTESATGEGVTGVAGQARTDWHVINDAALGQEAARAWTRVPALLLHAGHIGRTLCVDGAFRLAIWRAAFVRGQTRTRWYASYVATLGERAAGRWYARVSHLVVYHGRAHCNCVGRETMKLGLIEHSALRSRYNVLSIGNSGGENFFPSAVNRLKSVVNQYLSMSIARFIVAQSTRRRLDSALIIIRNFEVACDATGTNAISRSELTSSVK